MTICAAAFRARRNGRERIILLFRELIGFVNRLSTYYVIMERVIWFAYRFSRERCRMLIPEGKGFERSRHLTILGKAPEESTATCCVQIYLTCSHDSYYYSYR